MNAGGQEAKDSRKGVVCRCAARSKRLRGKAATKTLSPATCNLSPERGFTLIELIVVIVIVVTLAGTLLNRVWFYQEQAEKTAMVEVAGAIQTALVLQYGRLMARGAEADAVALAADNPMNWLAKQPANYSGEYYDPTPRSVAPGNWVFDLKARELVYVVDRSEHFSPGKSGQKWVRYRVNLMRESAQGISGKNSREIAGALFEPAEPYRWF